MRFVLEMNTFETGDYEFHVGDEHFSAENKRVEKITASYQQLPNKTSVELTFETGSSPLWRLWNLYLLTAGRWQSHYSL